MAFKILFLGTIPEIQTITTRKIFWHRTISQMSTFYFFIYMSKLLYSIFMYLSLFPYIVFRIYSSNSGPACKIILYFYPRTIFHSNFTFFTNIINRKYFFFHPFDLLPLAHFIHIFLYNWLYNNVVRMIPFQCG
jgi:hypothetical protein